MMGDHKRGECTCLDPRCATDRVLRRPVRATPRVVGFLPDYAELCDPEHVARLVEAQEKSVDLLPVRSSERHDQQQVDEAREREASASPEREEAARRLHAHGPRGQG